MRAWKHAALAAAIIMSPLAAGTFAQAQAQGAIRETKAARPNQQARIGQLRAHLLYEETGRLSENIAPPRQFTAWNTIIGEGDAQEVANDLLVTVEVLTRGEQNVSDTLRLVARNARGRVLAQRSFAGLLTSAQGRALKSILVPEIGCAGAITITASIGTHTKVMTLDFPCGE